MKHTKWPWKAKDDKIRQDGTNHPIAQVFGQFSGGEYAADEVAANGAIIAAAPEMLEMLMRLHDDPDFFAGFVEIKEEVSALIDKARGEL